MATETLELDPILKLTKAIKEATSNLTPENVRYLVDYYYQMQKERIRADAQLRTLGDEEPDIIMDWLGENTRRFEGNIRLALNAYSDKHPVGQWAKSIPGIGPVIAAGLLAHVDITRCETVGGLWRFAGLDPTLPRMAKGEKRAWNARLKVVCWKAGESFVKVCNKEDDIYGHVYATRKELETDRNERGEFADQAADKLANFKIGKDTDAYKAYSQGKLPPAHIHARAKRYAVKLFLAHYHHVAYETHYGVAPPKPYIFTQPGHTHFIAPP